MARLLIFVFAFLVPGVTFAQSFPPTRWECLTTMGRFEQVAPGTGWLIVRQPLAPPQKASNCTSPHLYLTDTNGQTWRDISPPHMPVRDDPSVFFLDRSHGWVLSAERLEGENEPKSYLLSTEDAGGTWHTTLVKWPPLPDYEYSRPVQVFFLDERHGWIMWQWHMMHGHQHALLATEDGGGTWKQVPRPPGGGQLQFLSAQQGWIIGGPEEPDGIPVPQAENLWATTDGGVHWRVVKIPLPPAPAVPDFPPRQPYFIGFRFTDALHGVVAAERQSSDDDFQEFTSATEDGGKTWRISSFTTYHAVPSFVGGHIVWSVLERPNGVLMIRSGERVTSPTLVGAASLMGRLRDVAFLDDSNGWTVYHHDESSDLVATTDGGKAFAIISPEVVARAPLPPPVIAAVNGKTTFKFAGPISQIPPYAAAGGVLLLIGSGFLPENTVRIGGRTIQAAAESGRGLRFFVPFDVPRGIQQVLVQNARGTSNTVQVEIRPPAPLRLSHLCDSRGKYLHIPKIHPGERISVVGSGFSQENTIWFGTRSQPANISLETSGPVLLYGFRPLYFVVPVDLPPGAYDFYVTNPGGKSNVIQVQVE